MKEYKSYVFLVQICLLALCFLSFSMPGYSQNTQSSAKHPLPKIITFNPDTTIYQEICDGDKDSTVFYSGVVTMAPGKSGHVHSTEIYEEMIMVLSGQAQVRITNGKNLDLEYGNIGFIPPDTEHQVFNTGTTSLKYIYVAVKSIQ